MGNSKTGGVISDQVHITIDTLAFLRTTSKLITNCLLLHTIFHEEAIWVDLGERERE